LNPC